MNKEKVTVAFKKDTGTILATHIGEEKDFLTLLSEDRNFLEEHQIEDVKGLEATVFELDLKKYVPADLFIRKGALTERLVLSLSTDAPDNKNPNGVPEVKGDGGSSCVITATILNARGKIEKTFSGELRFTTSRGRLSARNGIVKAIDGTAKITLTSSPESVSQVIVRAYAAGCKDGFLGLEFY